MSQVIGYIAKRTDGGLAKGRWALFHADGRVSNTFAQDEDRAAVVAILARNGLTVREDDKVERG